MGARLSGPWLVLAAAMLWGTTGTAQALAPAGARPEAVGALRLLVGGAALLAVAAARGALRRGGRWSWGTVAWAAGGVAAYQLCFFAAVARTGVAVGTLVGIGSAPILAGVLDLLVARSRPGGRWLAATALAIVGCGLLATSGGEVRIDALGLVLAVGAGGAYAVYTLASKRLLVEHSPDAVMAIVFCLGAVALAPLLLLADLRWLGDVRGVAVILHLGLIATALAYALFARGLSAVAAATAVTLSLAEPLTAGVLGIVVLREQIAIQGIAGIGLIFAGLVVLTGRAGSGERATEKH